MTATLIDSNVLVGKTYFPSVKFIVPDQNTGDGSTGTQPSFRRRDQLG